MGSCYQFETQTTLEHGYCVLAAYLKLRSNTIENQKYVPDWFIKHFVFIQSQQLSIADVSTYLIYHDCAKFLVYQKDFEGNSHFPGHAKASEALWQTLFGKSIISDLIGRDMDMHLLKPSDISKYDRPDLVPTLLLCALSELHANAAMFGGFESVSFKIKLKAITRLGNAFFRLSPTIFSKGDNNV